MCRRENGQRRGMTSAASQERRTAGVKVVGDKQGGEMELPEGRLSDRGNLKAEPKSTPA